MAMGKSDLCCWKCGNPVAEGSSYCVGHSDAPVRVRFGKYLVEDDLGSGGFGEVYKCFDPDLGRSVAIKRLINPRQSILDARREGGILARLAHPNIVSVHEYLEDERSIVMEYMDGGTLEDKLNSDANWVRENFEAIIDCVCDAVLFAHSQGIVHRDLKPANIFLSSDGVPKVGDFGVSAILQKSGDFTNTPIGTLPYMSPEAIIGGPYSYEADVHSLGCIMYEIWAGKLPWVASGNQLAWHIAKTQQKPEQLIALPINGVDDVLNDLIMRMISPGEGRIINIGTAKQMLDSRNVRNCDVETIDDLRNWLGSIYGYANGGKSLLNLLSQYSIASSETIRAMLNGDDERRVVPGLLVRQFAWLCAVITASCTSFSDLILLKYDGECPYCGAIECECDKLPLKSVEEKNRHLLKKLSRNSLKGESASQALPVYQAMFRRIYCNCPDNTNLQLLALHSHAEVAEAMDAVIHLHPDRSEDSFLALMFELADLIAWFFALLNYYSSKVGEIDLAAKLHEQFGSGCYVCGRNPCVCTEPAGVLGWRDVIRDNKRGPFLEG